MKGFILGVAFLASLITIGVLIVGSVRLDKKEGLKCLTMSRQYGLL